MKKLQKIIKRISKIDKIGVFANREINKNEELFIFSDNVIELKHKPGCHCEICCRCIQIGEYAWLYPEENSFGWYLNHSCNPSCGIRNNKIIAIENIKKGGEITIDYSTTNNDMDWVMDCSCNSKDCRKKIRSVQFLPEELFKKYESFMPEYISRCYPTKS
jgi:SET domain-containing protein